MAEVGIVGSYPPPYGGVSVYIKRLSDFLRMNNYDHTCYAHNLDNKYSSNKSGLKENIIIINCSKKWLVKYFFSPHEKLIHLNKITPIHFFTFGMLRKIRGKKLIINRHGEHIYAELPKNSNNWKDRLKIACYNYGFRSADHIIIVNEKMRSELNQLGISNRLISCIPAFIPPSVSVENSILKKPVEDFIRKHKYILCSNGSIRFFKGQDLYGIDLMFDLIERIDDQDLGLVIYLRGTNKMTPQERRHYQLLIERVNDLGLKEKILLYESYDEEFWPILARSHIFVRPTNTDGDAVSVREALFFGLRTICSDVTYRPEGVILFKNRDIEDLKEKVIDALDHVKKKGIKKTQDNDLSFSNAQQIMELYKRLLQ